MREVEPGEVLLFDRDDARWLRFARPERTLVARGVVEVGPVLREVERRVDEGAHAAGFVSYEAAPAFDRALAAHAPDGFPLAWFGVYEAPEEVATPPAPGDDDAPSADWSPSISRAEYDAAIARIKDLLRDGETYQVNFSYRLRAAFGAVPAALFARMVRAQTNNYGAFIQTPEWAVCSASPELFFRLDGRRLVSHPMKGTAPRGLWPDDDRRQAEALRASEKNRAENAMIVDMVRNDMGRVADLGSVRVASRFDLERHPTLWQMTSAVECLTDAGFFDIMAALFPAASITGAPKVRTTQIVAELENAPRHIYTGAIGYLAPGRRAQFNVAIRTVLVDRRDGRAEYGVGGGIVWDSEPGDEFDECRTKARVLTAEAPEFDLLETMLWTPEGGFLLLERHLTRLADSAEYFDRRVDLDDVRRRLEALAAGLPSAPHRARLLVSRDGAARVEATPHGQTRTDTDEHGQAPPDYRLELARRPVDSGDVFLYHKTTRRGVYQRALAEAPGVADVLLFNERGEVTESCIANVVVELDGRLWTPPVASGLLAGVYRAHLLERGDIAERPIRVDDLANATKIALINSVRKMWRPKVCF